MANRRVFTIDVSKTLGSLNSLTQSILKGIDDEIDDSAEAIASNARIDVPRSEFGAGLAGSISVKRGKFLQRTVVAEKFYAPYVEFGTGEYARSYVPTLPEDIQKYAKSFFVNGKGRMPPTPFIFPNVVRQIPILTDKIVEVINNS